MSESTSGPEHVYLPDSWVLSVQTDTDSVRFLMEAVSSSAITRCSMAATIWGAVQLRIGELSGVPGLRSRRFEGFPCGWFYFERVDNVDVVRLLAYAQDLAMILGDIGQAIGDTRERLTS